MNSIRRAGMVLMTAGIVLAGASVASVGSQASGCLTGKIAGSVRLTAVHPCLDDATVQGAVFANPGLKVSVTDSRIGGPVILENERSVFVDSNNIFGAVILSGNSADTVSNNTIHGALRCVSSPTTGGGNTVFGAETGDCAGLG